MRVPKPDMIRVFAQIAPNQLLRDVRLTRRFSVFGTVMTVARQYGIKFRPVDGGLEFIAPKSRMQMFVEKLHFSGIPYQEIM